MKEIVCRFLRSPLGISVWGASAFAAAALAAAGLAGPLAAAGLCLALGTVATFAFLSHPLGARSVVAERDRARAESDARVLGRVAAARKRLSLVRVGDGAVKAELDRLVLAAGRYLEEAVKRDARDPVSEDAVVGAVELMNDYLSIVDAAAAAGRGGQAADASVVVDRTVRALAASADEIEGRLGTAPRAADRISAREETR